MITLFRRIRQKLIDSGSITKYLLYAVGEILLVVIGILIALQVNNWNEERAENRERIDLLMQLRTDLNNVAIELEQQIQASEIRVTFTKRLLNYSAGTEEFSSDSLQFASQMLTNSSFFNDFNTTFEQAKSSGKLSLIQSGSLLFALSLLERSNEGLNIVQDGMVSFFNSPDYNSYFTKMEMLNNIEQNARGEYSFAPDMHPELDIMSTGEAFFKETDTYEMMYKIQTYNSLELLWLVDYRQSVDEVIRQIDVELSR